MSETGEYNEVKTEGRGGKKEERGEHETGSGEKRQGKVRGKGSGEGQGVGDKGDKTEGIRTWFIRSDWEEQVLGGQTWPRATETPASGCSCYCVVIMVDLPTPCSVVLMSKNSIGACIPARVAGADTATANDGDWWVACCPMASISLVHMADQMIPRMSLKEQMATAQSPRGHH